MDFLLNFLNLNDLTSQPRIDENFTVLSSMDMVNTFNLRVQGTKHEEN